MEINELRLKINAKGYTVDEFLTLINRSRDWFYKHSNNGKDYKFLSMAIDGLKIMENKIDLRSKHDF